MSQNKQKKYLHWKKKGTTTPTLHHIKKQLKMDDRPKYKI